MKTDAVLCRHGPLYSPSPLGKGRQRGKSCGAVSGGRAFTIVELLVVVSIILVLMTMVAAAASAARGSQKRSGTAALIAKLNIIVMTQLATYDSKNIQASNLPAGIPNKSQARSWYIRRNMITGDLPDRWTDVAYMADPSNAWQLTSPAQRTYINIYNAASVKPTNLYAGAECLFMIVMQGGIASCLDCGSLNSSDFGDKDADGFQEFWDSWGNPIGYILWPAAVELPAGGGTPFFAGTRQLVAPFSGTPGPTLGIKPLIYSAGPDGEYSFDRNNESKMLDAGTSPVGRDCGNWQVSPTSVLGGLSSPDYRSDNITNLDLEAKQ